MVGARVGGRRLAAGVVALLVAASGVVACSDGGGDAGSSVSVPPTSVASDAAVPSVEASESPAGEVTAESLSDEELGYIVTSIPEDLTPAQEEVLVAFAAYDRFTWSYWFAPARPEEGIAGGEQYLTSDFLQTFEENYASREAGLYSAGVVRLAVVDVRIDEMYVPFTAEVSVCMDRSEFSRYNAAGEEVTAEGSLGTDRYYVVMSTIEGEWKASDEVQVSTNECVV